MTEEMKKASKAMETSQHKAQCCFTEIKEDKDRISAELKIVSEELVTKDCIIKTLTKENLQVNSKVTQL
jgi:hypothetical protein